MNRIPLYKQFATAEPLAVLPLSNFGGIILLSIEEDYYNGEHVVSCYDFGNGREDIRRHKIEYTAPAGCGERMFIRMNGTRYYLDQFEKVGA